MADVESNINVNIDTSSALASIKRLQAEISTFHQQMAKGGAAAAASSAQLQQGLVNSVNATGNFSASMTRIKSATESFTTSLEKNKFSMGEYFRYAGASTKTFGRLFSSEFNTIEKVARERVKDLQTQYIKLGRDANGAMKAIAVRPLTLDMNDLGTKTAIAAQKQQIFNQLMKQGSTNLLNFGKNTQWAGRQLMVGFTVPLTIMGAAAAREFKKIEEEVIRFKRVYGDAMTSTSETDAMANNLKTLAREFTQYGLAVADTLKLAADAAAMGKTGADLTAQVSQASRLAALGNVSQQEALSTTTSLTSTLSIATKDLASNINFLNAVENQTVTSIEDLTTAIPTAAPVIQQLGGDVKDLAFFLTAMREGGINASEGANALKSGLASMINPTTQATAMLQSFGINLDELMSRNRGNVKQMVLDLGNALNSLDPTNRAQAIEQMFGKFQFARMSTLFQNVTKQGTQASRVLDLSAKSTAELAILAERELKRVSDSPLYKFEKAMEDFKASLAPVGEAFLKAVTPIIEWGGKVLEWFNGWNDQAKNIGVVLAIAIGGLGPVLLMAFGLISNGAANIIKMFMGLRNMFLRTGGGSKILGEQLNYMSQEQLQAATVAASLDQAHNKLRQTFTSEASAIGQLIAQYQAATAAQSRFMSSPGNVRKGRPPVKKADGGIITGPGTGTSDSIPAMLSNGEAVIPAEAVRQNPGLVKGLIAGNIPGFAEGYMGNLYPEYAMRMQNATENMSQSAGKTGLANVLAPMSLRVGEARGTSPTQSRVNSGMFDSISEELKDVTKKFVDNVNKNFDTTFKSIKDTDERFAKSWSAAGKAVEKEVNSIKDDAAKGVVRKTFGLEEDVYGTAATEVRKPGDKRLTRGRKSVIDTGVKSYTSIRQPAKTMFERISGQSGADMQMGHVFGPQQQDLAELSKSSKATPALKRAMKSVGINVVEEVTVGVEQAAQNASPSKRGRKAGKDIADGILIPVEKSQARARAAGTKIADITRNTNPAFGRVPQMPPVATVGMKKFIGERSAKMTQSVVQAQMSQMGGMKILTATEVKLRDATKMLAGSKVPLDMLTSAAQKTKVGLTSAATSIKNFSADAASKLSTSIKSVALRTKEAAISIGNSARQIAVSAGQGMAAAPGKIGAKMKGKGAGLGGGASMALMMGSSMLPEGMGAGGAILGATGMGASMGSMLGPWGAGIGAALGLVSSSAMALKDAFDSAQRSAETFAKTTGASISAIRAISVASGNVSAGEVMDKRRSEQGQFQRSEETNAVAQSYLESETGQAASSSLAESIKKGGSDAGASSIASQMATAIASGAINRIDAKAIVEDMGKQIGDSTFAMKANAQIDKIVGPNGENLATDPIDVRVNIVKESGTQIAQAAQSMSKVSMQKSQQDIGKNLGGFANIGAVRAVTDVMALIDAMQDVGTASAAFAANLTIGSQQSKEMLDSLQLDYEKRIEIAKAAGDTAEAERLTTEYMNGRKEILTQTAANSKAAQDAYAASSVGMKTATIGSLDQQARDLYKDTPQAALVDPAIAAIGDNTKDGSTVELVLKQELSAGTIDPATLTNMVNLLGEDNIQVTADIIANVGGVDADRVFQFANMANNQLNAINFTTQMEDLSPEQSAKVLDTLDIIQQYGGEVALDIAVNGKVSNVEQIAEDLKKVDEYFADGEQKIYEVGMTFGSTGFALTQSQAEYFNGLSPSDQKTYTTAYLTVLKTIDANSSAGMEELRKWASQKGTIASYSKGASGFYGGGTVYDYEAMGRDYAAEEAQSAVSAAQAAAAAAAGGGGGGDGGGGGGGGQQEAPRTITEVIADQQKRITAINDQTSAVRKLVAAGLSLADAYAIASNAEDAALIAHGATAEQLADLTAKTRAAEKATKDLAAAQSVANAAMDTKEKNALAAKLAADATLTDIQKRFLLENADAARLYMNPTFDPAALKQALLDAQNASTYEFNINRVTIPGLQEIWQKGMSNAAEAFSAQQTVIDLNFKIQKDPFKDIIEAGQRAIQDIQNKPGGLDDLDADLQRISDKEFQINKAYDEKTKALEEVSRINDRIISQQKSQLGLANALSTGDIAAAARAAQDMQAQGSLNSIADQKTALDEARKAEIEGLTGKGGLTREQIEERVRDLKAQILEIEEQRIEPAQRQMDLLERMQQDQIDALTVLGKTKDEWDGINSSLELANTKTKEFQDAMKEALSIATTLGTALATGVVPSIGSNAPAAAPVAPPAARGPFPGKPGGQNLSQGSRGQYVEMLQTALNKGGAGIGVDGIFGPQTARAVTNFQRSQGLTVDGIAGDQTWGKLYALQYYKKGGKVAYMSKGGKMSYMAMGGMAKMFAKGTDTIPAMLSAGEFVMSKPAVDKVGTGRLAELNRGYDRNTNSRSDSVYNYSISVNASTNANPREIANTVLAQIKQVDTQRIRSNRF